MWLSFKYSLLLVVTVSAVSVALAIFIDSLQPLGVSLRQVLSQTTAVKLSEMGDSNPIKFGPEWLRNLSRERSTGPNPQNSGPQEAVNPGVPKSSGGHANPSSGTSNATKVLLAKLRYGREEMLALYDKSSEAPQELKYIDILYRPRGKPPYALMSNTFEEDTPRTFPQSGGMTSGEKFGIGRDRGGRGTTSWDQGPPRMPGNSGGTDDKPPLSRSWSTNNGGNAASRSGGDQGEWNQNKMYRSKHPGTNTNWRTMRDDEEWRVSDNNNRSRSTQEKWERDWGNNRSVNRRTRVGRESQSGDDNLPEWAVDNAEGCGGTFDSLGAFHGYSNDDTNLPKTQDAPFALTRSHTHGSFARSKAAEEGSDEWWASEKSKKLSPKRFDVSDVKFKKPNTIIPEINSGNNLNTAENNKEKGSISKDNDKLEPPAPPSEPSDSNSGNTDNKYKKNVRFTESKTFDSLMRSEINQDEANNDERGNFQSVMITPNNSLRQKHQNIVQSSNNNVSRENQKPGLHYLVQNAHGTQSEPELLKSQPTPEDEIADDLNDIALKDKEQYSSVSKLQNSNKNASKTPSAIPSSMSVSVSQMSDSTLQQLRMSSSVHMGHGLTMTSKSGLPSPGIHNVGLQAPGIQSNVLQSVVLQGPSLQGGGLQNAGLQSSGLQGPGIQATGFPGLQNSGMARPGLQVTGLPGSGLQGLQGLALPGPGLQSPQVAGLPTLGINSVGISNSALNASLGLSLGPTNSLSQAMGIPMPGAAMSVMPEREMGNQGLGSTGLKAGGQNISGFPSGGLPGMSGANVVNSSLFLGQNTNIGSLQSSNEKQMNHGNQNMYPLHGLQHSDSQSPFNLAMYNNIMQQPQTTNSAASKSLTDKWYYEDPNETVQGPFTSKQMFSWYRAGYFNANLMVRRASDAVMRPLGSYGNVVPFAQDQSYAPDHMISSFPLASGFEARNQGTHTSMLNSQPGHVLDVESLWSQASPSPELLWAQQALNARNESRVSNLPTFFWDQQPLTSRALSPEGLPKSMMTEDEILAQLRAQSQSVGPQKLTFGSEQPPVSSLSTLAANKPEDAFSKLNLAPNLKDLQNLIQEDSVRDIPVLHEPKIKNPDSFVKTEQVQTEASKAVQKEAAAESLVKQTKEADKSAKNKENNVTKNKSNKKEKDEKRQESVEKKREAESEKTLEKRLEEHSPTKSKKEEKLNKKELEKERKEWMKEGFTVVKTEKPTKDNKNKAAETKAAEEAERKKREEDRLAAEEEKKKRQAELYKKQQEMTQQQQQRQAAESVVKKAPWSGVTTQAQTLNKDGLTLAEIQRMEKEKKLEQMKEQQHMMQLIAQQQAASLAREQEMQKGLGWAKKKSNLVSAGQSLAEIQAESRKQAQASKVFEEPQRTAQPTNNNLPWGSSQIGGGGFWENPSPAVKTVQPETLKPAVDATRSKKKATSATPREVPPAAEFDTWCTTVLKSWSDKIDVPTFVDFLKDIVSPYEVKDYVKCYLGDTKDSNDFARHFLERRSKLLRVGMVTQSDDLCSPAMAINPRTVSNSDSQEVKSKGKKAKKNKMTKIDAAGLISFSVTAAEDRINVGDIDTV